MKTGIGELFLYIWLKLQLQREIFHTLANIPLLANTEKIPFSKAGSKDVVPQQRKQQQSIVALMIPPMHCLCGSTPSLTLHLHFTSTSCLEKTNLSQVIGFLTVPVLGLFRFHI